jgi:hypothetical protein
LGSFVGGAGHGYEAVGSAGRQLKRHNAMKTRQEVDGWEDDPQQASAIVPPRQRLAAKPKRGQETAPGPIKQR